MAAAALGALYLNARFEAATVLFLYSIAEYFEGYIEDRARRTVEKLSKFMPDQARIVADGAEKIVRVNEVEPNMTLLVRPGERIPLDGTLLMVSHMLIKPSSQGNRCLCLRNSMIACMRAH